MNTKRYYVPFLLVASTLAMIGLVIFQLKWIDHSRKLSEEIFNQRASMALCSTLDKYSDGAVCSQSCSAVCGTETNEDTSSAMQPDLMSNAGFNSDLRRTLNFYNINLPYQVYQTQEDPLPLCDDQAPMCVVNLPPHVNQEASFVTLAFPDKQKFILGNIRYMIGTSILILLFTALVLWLANWWLHKQKKLLRTNAEIYNQMAHEFRTPLTNIHLAANLLSKNEHAPANLKFLEIIQKENSRLIQQVERVLHLARLDNGEYALSNERLPLKQILLTVIDNMRIQIEEKQAVISLEAIPDDLEIYGDKLHLANVFTNLIDNALKYNRDQPEITFAARNEGNGILISIQDNGIGIPPSKCKMIFEKFERLDDHTSRDQKGFGLGLAYVKRIIELHKGTIQLDGQVVQGSRFNLFLPKLT